MKSPILPALALFSVVSAAFAGHSTIDSKDSKDGKVIEPACPPALNLIASFAGSYVGEADFQRKDGAKGDALSYGAEIDYRTPLSLSVPEAARGGQWMLKTGFAYGRRDFDNSGGLPIPNALQSVSGVFGLELYADCEQSLVDGEPVLQIETRPGLYFGHHASTADFNAPTLAYVPLYYTPSHRFVLVGGVSYDGFRQSQFIPFLAFRWRVTDNFTVQGNPVRPRLVYSPTKNLDLYVGGEYITQSFRADGRDSTEKRRLNGALVTYSDERVGGGIAWKNDHVRLDLGGGWSLTRKFNFHRAEEGYHTYNGAAYVEAQASIGF